MKSGTAHGAHAISTDEDVESMIEKANINSLKWVHIFDSTDQFPYDKED